MVDQTPPENRIDPTLRVAGASDQRVVYMWTFAHTDGEDRAKPADFTRQQFADAVVEAYERAGKIVNQWAVFWEVHPLSRSAAESTNHFHMVVESERPSRWVELAKFLREQRRIFIGITTSSSRNAYWTAFGYLYAPNAKKTKDDIDATPLLSIGHETPPQQLINRRQGLRRLHGTEIFEAVQKHGLTTVARFFAFASRQHGAGDKSWVQFCMSKGEAQVRQAIRSAMLLGSAQAQEVFQAMTHMQILVAALRRDCICEGRAPLAWTQILQLNSIDVAAYCASMLELFEHGGGKGLNHYYVGAPNTGKTALTRALLELFGAAAFRKPQVGTSFALAGLVGAKALIWNDFYWPHPPLSWGDLLNVLDNEGFGVGVPKGDGQADYPWNREGNENVIAVFTSNAPVVYVSSNRTIDPVRTAAWNERFGENVLQFNVPLPSPDRRFKTWLRCTRCYAEWVLRNGRPGGVGPGGLGPSRATGNPGPAGQAAVPEQPRVTAPQPPPQPRAPASRSRSPARGSSGSAHDANPSALTLALRGHGSSGSGHRANLNAPPLVVQKHTPCAITEPLRELNLFLQRNGMEPAVFSFCLDNEETGLWTCQVSAGGVSSRGSSVGKKDAKREACRELLRALRELSGQP